MAPNRLLDAWAPEFDVRSRHSIRIAAAPEKVCATLMAANLSDIGMVRFLMRLRGYGGEIDRHPAAASFTENVKRGGFILLEEDPGREIVLGIAGQFWKPHGNLQRKLTPDEFRLFDREGFALGYWNFEVLPNHGGTELRTETRVLCFGAAARRRFKLYWSVISPFSGLLRIAMLRHIRQRAEMK